MKTNIRSIVVGCTPLAEKIALILERDSNLVGIVNLHPTLGATKSNYRFVDINDVPFYNTKDINDTETKQWLRDRESDIIVQCGWSQVFKEDVLGIPKKYCLGFHPSPLPTGRGAAILNWKIIESNGKDVEWGNSLFVMKRITDSGRIIDFEPFVIEKRDNIRTAYLKVDETSCKMLVRSLPKLALRDDLGTKQDHTKATRYFKRTPEDGLVKLTWSAAQIHDYIRALTHPYPGAYFNTKIGTLSVWESEIVDSPNEDIGHVIEINKNGVVIMTGHNSAIRLKRVTYGHQEYWADDLFEKLRIKEGENIRNDLE